MGSYYSYLKQLWQAEPEELDHPANIDGKQLYWWEATSGKRNIKGWCRYHPDDLLEFHKADRHAFLDGCVNAIASGHVAFYQVDLDRLLELTMDHTKRNIIEEFKSPH